MVKRKGRLPRVPKGKKPLSIDPITSKSLRLRREKKMTAYSSGLPPKEELENIVTRGEQLIEKGKEVKEEIEAEEEKLREKILPEISEPYEREVTLTKFVERLPERIPEPPKPEKRIAEVGKKIVTKVAPLVKTAVTKFKKKQKEVEKKQKKYEEAVNESV